MWNVKVNDQVICIVDKTWKVDASTGKEIWPEKYGMYTVSEIMPFKDRSAIKLKEIVNIDRNGREIWYNTNAFRPVSKTDISELEKLLNNIPNKADDEEYLIRKVEHVS